MKNNISLRFAVIALILLASFTGTKLQAQKLLCNYGITNNLPCPIVISYMAQNCQGAPTCNQTGITIPPFGGTYFIPGSCCLVSCDIFVSVLIIGGFPVTQTPPAVSSGNNFGGGTTSSACSNTPPNWTITWTNAGVTIN